MSQTLATTCCVVGGGPAGVMLAYLLARRGVAVTVLEKHGDFFRDFRGDTVHPSTLELFHELGLLDAFLHLPHQRLEKIGGVFGDFRFDAADFRHVPAHCRFVALMPQWDFLNFLSAEARKFPGFDLRMQHEAVGLLTGAGRITGVEVRTPAGPLRVQAGVVIGCDGRHSAVRQAAGLEVLETGVPIDVLWFRISRQTADPEEVFGNVNYGRALVLINRDTYFQAGLIVEKGSFEQIRSSGIEEFRRIVARIAPYLAARVHELQSWDQVKLLTVQINRLRRWYRPGLLCIGDAAHAMSPAGGVGINLAIQDAVAAANLLARPLLEHCVDERSLALVQRRREMPARVTQLLQVNAHQGFTWVFRHPGPIRAPWQLKAAFRIPGIQRVIGLAVGIGLRPEHVDGARPRPSLVRKFAFCAALACIAGGVLLRRHPFSCTKRRAMS
jgi:2-polyprenyl-6-methoxyphenol hydroxylase-like FAD-dependent oxidoreductase